jgi:toxin HigB-1
MKVVFINRELEYIYEFGDEPGKPKFPPEVVKGFIRKINLLLDIKSTAELRLFKGARYEKLSGNLKGFESIRINDQFRIILQIRTEEGNDSSEEAAFIFDIADYHK